MKKTSWWVVSLAAVGIFACRSSPQTGRTETVRADPLKPPAFRLPAGARPLHYRLEITVDPHAESAAGHEEIEVELTQAMPVLWLNAKLLKVSEATWTGPAGVKPLAVLPGGDDFVGFRFPKPEGPGTGTLKLSFQAAVQDRDWQGIFRQKEGSDFYVFTQFESTFARRAFPCFDEPSFKVPWELSLNVPSGVIAVSNSAVRTAPGASTPAPNGMQHIVFEPTLPIPSYLVAFAVGPFDIVDAGVAGSQKTPLRVLVPKGHPGEAADLARIMGPLLETEERYFGRPFPYPKLDVVDVPVFLGAMENAGLITYIQGLAIAPPSQDTLAAKHERASVYAHELAHQWFGDLVTLAWWDDVWLNESFTSWMTSKALKQWKPQLKEVFEELGARRNAMTADRLLSAKAIHQPVTSQDEIEDAFNSGIAYDKGQTVISMVEQWVGPDAFQRGVQRYLKDHAFGNATSAQLFEALSQEAGHDVATVFGSFVNQPGVPLVSMSLDCPVGKPPSLHLSQRRYLPLGTSAPREASWSIPVCVRSAGAKVPEKTCTVLSESASDLTLPNGSTCPAWVLPNAGGLGYYRSELQGSLLHHLLQGQAKPATAEELVSLIGDVSALTVSGQLNEAQRLGLVSSLHGRPEAQVQEALLEVAQLDDNLVPPPLRPLRARFVQKSFAKRAHELGLVSKAGEDEATRRLRAGLVATLGVEGEDDAVLAHARKLTESWLRRPEAISADMVDVLLSLGARKAPVALLDKMIESARAEKDRLRRTRLLSALGATEDPSAVPRVLTVVLDKSFEPTEASFVLFHLTAHEATRDLAYAFFKEHFDEIASRLPAQVVAGMPAVGRSFCDAEHRADVEKFFRPRVDRFPGARHALDSTLERMDLCIRLTPERRASVARFLRAYGTPVTENAE